MDSKDAKWEVVIFDMDGTLYDLQDVIDMNYQMQVNFFSHWFDISCSEAKRIFKENNILPYLSTEAKSATEFFSKIGIDMQEWKNYRNMNFDVNKINVSKAADDNIIRKFHMKYRTVLLTSNSLINIKKVFRHLKISMNNFDMIICSDYNYPYNIFDKSHAMEFITEVLTVSPQKCLSIGDRYETDIVPITTLGGTGVVLGKPKALYDVYNYLEGIYVDCCDFVFYAK